MDIEPELDNVSTGFPEPIKLFAGFLIGGYAAGLGFGRATRAPNINNRT
jgi:hypothetical protein